MEDVAVLFGVLFALILFTFLVFVLYSGLLIQIKPGVGSPLFINNKKIAYKFGRGPYSKEVGQYFSEVTGLVPHLSCIGLYYDDPKEVPPEKLRWAVGCILPEGEAGELDLQYLTEKGYRTWNLPTVSSVVLCTFPYRTFLSLFIAIYRVYPLMGEYVKLNKLCAHPFMELYPDDGNIYFMAPLAKQDEFYVPEANCDPGDETGDEEDEQPLDVVRPSTSGGSNLRKRVTQQESKSQEARSPKQKVTDSTGKRSTSEEIISGKLSTTAVQDADVSSTASATPASSSPGDTAPVTVSPSESAVSETTSPSIAGQSSASSSETDVSEPFEVIKKEETQ